MEHVCHFSQIHFLIHTCDIVARASQVGSPSKADQTTAETAHDTS